MGCLLRNQFLFFSRIFVLFLFRDLFSFYFNEANENCKKNKINEHSLKFKSKQKCQLYFQMKAYLSQMTIITTINFIKFCFNKLEASLGSNIIIIRSNNNNSIKFIERKGLLGIVINNNFIKIG